MDNVKVVLFFMAVREMDPSSQSFAIEKTRKGLSSSNGVDTAFQKIIIAHIPPHGGFMKIKIMEEKKKKQIINRVSYLSGHLKGVKKMIEEDKYCIDIIKQNEAVIAALHKVNEMILENHLDTCVTEAIKGKSESERREKINELLEIYKNSK